MDIVSDALAYSLIVVLTLAALSKVRRFGLFAEQLADYDIVPYGWVRSVAVLVVGLEIAGTALIAYPATRNAGLLAVSGLFSVFLLNMGLARVRGKKISCACFGPGNSLDVIGPVTLVRTALFVISGVVSFAAGRPGAFRPASLLAALLILSQFALIPEGVRILTEIRRFGSNIVDVFTESYESAMRAMEGLIRI